MSSLKEGANTSPECNGTSEELNASAQEPQEGREPERAVGQKIRKCLICRTLFSSAWGGAHLPAVQIHLRMAERCTYVISEGEFTVIDARAEAAAR